MLGNKQNLGGEQIEGSFVTVGTELDAVGADVVLDDLALLGLLLSVLLVADLPRSGLVELVLITKMKDSSLSDSVPLGLLVKVGDSLDQGVSTTNSEGVEVPQVEGGRKGHADDDGSGDLLGEITTEVLWGGDGAVSQGNFTENPSSEKHSSKEKVLLVISIKNQLIGKISS